MDADLAQELVDQVRNLTAKMQQMEAQAAGLAAENQDWKRRAEEAMKASSESGRRGHTQRQILDRRTALTVRKYKGNTEEWRDWSMCFKRLMLSMEYVVYTTMNDVEKETGEVNEDDDYSENTEENAIRRKASGELFDLLCSLCEGDALAVVTATEDCKGFLAWQRLASKCNARTMARAIKNMAEPITLA